MNISIKQINDLTFEFYIIYHKPMYEWSEKPEWDKVGAVSHLLPTYSYVNSDAIRWLKDNNINFTVDVDLQKRKSTVFVKISSIEEALAFKLRWI